MKIFNVGLTSNTGTALGFQVMAENMDAAEAKARARCGAITPWIGIQPGATLQARDPNGGNEYFDRNFRLVAVLL